MLFVFYSTLTNFCDFFVQLFFKSDIMNFLPLRAKSGL